MMVAQQLLWLRQGCACAGEQHLLKGKLRHGCVTGGLQGHSLCLFPPLLPSCRCSPGRRVHVFIDACTDAGMLSLYMLVRLLCKHAG